MTGLADPDGTVVAIDVGGTTIKAAAVTATGEVLREASAPTPATDGAAAVVAAITRTARALVDTSTRAVSVVVPGVVDTERGIAVYAANIGWRDVPLRDLLGRELGLPVHVGHDVTAAGLAERRAGAARDVTHALIVVIGTGVAAVVVSDGTVITGARGTAGELGHVRVVPDGEPCGCGGRGCLEAYASAGAVARRYRAAGGAALAAVDVVATVDRDPLAARVWGEAVAALATGIGGAVALLDPELVVLAGGLSLAGEALLAPLAAGIGGALTWREPPRVALSPLGATGGRTGAALRGWDALQPARGPGTAT